MMITDVPAIIMTTTAIIIPQRTQLVGAGAVVKVQVYLLAIPLPELSLAPVVTVAV